MGDVKNFTAQDYSMRIWLRPDKLASLGITPSDIQNAIKEQNAQSPAGRIGAEPAPPGQESQFNVRALGLLKDPEGVRGNHHPLQPRRLAGEDQGRGPRGTRRADLRLARAIQQVGTAPRAPSASYLAPGANAIETADNVKKILEAAKERFPPDMAYDMTLDSTLPIKASMEEIVHTLFEAVVLVLIVVYIFLQSFRATIIPMCTVPVSLLGAFIMFPVLGFSVNVLTMFGLVLAIGIVVDDAIVVVEAVQHHLEHGKEPGGGHAAGDEGSVRAGRGHRFGPVRGVRAGGVHGRRDRPALQPVRPHHRRRGGLLGHQRADAQPRVVRHDAQETDAGTRPDREVLQIVQPVLRLAEQQLREHRRRPGPQGHVLHAAAGGGGRRHLAARQVRARRVHSGRGQGLSLRRRRTARRRVAPADGRNPQAGGSHCGRTPKASARPWASPGTNILNSLNFPNSAMMFVGLEPWEERKTPALHASALAARVEQEICRHPRRARLCLRPAAAAGLRQRLRLHHAIAGPFRRQRSSNWPAMSSNCTEAVAKRPEIGRVSTTFNPATPQVKVELDREKARTLGVPVDSVFQTLQTYLSGLYVNDFVRFGRVYKVFLQAEPQFTSKPERHRPVLCPQQRRPDGAPEHAGQDQPRCRGPNFVTRFNLYNAAEIMGAPAPGYSSGQAIKAIEEVMKTMPSEAGYEWSGLTLQEKKSEGQAPVIFGMAVLFVFLLLAAQYESWGLPFAVLLATPTVILGTMIGLLVRSYRPERVCADRPGHAHRAGGQERHSHRRVRQDETRGRSRDSRRRGGRIEAAPAADPDDLVRLHSRLRAADAGHRLRGRLAQHHGHGRGLSA